MATKVLGQQARDCIKKERAGLHAITTSCQIFLELFELDRKLASFNEGFSSAC